MSQKEEYRIGPCRILSAANVTDPIADWFDHGYTQGNVVATIQPGKTILNRVDQLGPIPLASAVWRFGDTFELSFPLIDKQLDNLLKVVPGSVKLTNNAKDALGIKTNVAKFSGRAWALVPVDEFTEDDPWWDADHAIMVFNGYANVNDRIQTYKLAEEDDLAPFEVTVTHVSSTHGRGTIGAAYLAGVDVIGFNVAAEIDKRVTSAATVTALNGAGINTLRDLVDNTGALNLSGATLTDPAGLEYAFNSSAIDLSTNSIPQAEMSDLIDAIWKVRASFGAASCALTITGNNGVDADATARINGTGAYAYAINAVNQANKSITIAGDHRDTFINGQTVNVENSTGNNGNYTYNGALEANYDPTNNQTTIYVNEAIPSATADGNVNDGLIGAGMTVTT